MHNPPASARRAFLRHRYRAHVQGWLAVAVGLLWGYYIDLYAHEPLWAMLPTAFIAAFFVVAVLVAIAAVLRFPWWVWAPFCLVSMMLEWVGRRLFKRPWRRSPQPRERFLSNPFALWQGWRLKRHRRARQQVQQPESWLPHLGSPISPTAPAARCKHPGFTWTGTGEYVAAAFEEHWKFWFISAPVWIGLWFWLIEGQDFFLSVILSVVLYIIFSLVLVIPLVAVLFALLSTLIVAAGMSPAQRSHAAAVLRQAHAAQSASVDSAATTTAPKGTSWLIPLLIGLWIGSVWGDDR